MNFVAPLEARLGENRMPGHRVSHGLRIVLRRGGLTIIDQMVASGTTFLTGVLIGRICSKEEFGFYMLGFSLFTFLMTLQSALVSTPYTIYLPRTAEPERARFTGSSLIMQLSMSGIAGLVIVLAGLLLSWVGYEAALSTMLFGLGVSISVLLLRDFVRQICFARLAVGHALCFDLAVACGQIAALAVLGHYNRLSPATAFLALGGVCGVSALGWYCAARTQIQMGLRNAVSDFGRSWQAGKWLFASGLIWSVSMNLYPWLVAGFHGAASAGTWAAALGVVTIINPFMLGIQNFLGPYIMHAFAEGGVERLVQVVQRAAAAYSGSLFLFSAFMFLFGDLVVTGIYGPKYTGNGALVALLSLNLAVNALGFSFSRGLFAMERAAIDFKVNIVALAAMLLCGIWLARAYGPTGAALGQLATNCAASVVRIAAFHQTHRRLLALGAVL
ncbi:MAG: hypothetical protein AMXMBFR84_21700 [Candidatus Hydrogenedentota bacterium]